MLQILEVAKEDEGAYRCVVSNSARKDTSHEARLTVTSGEGFSALFFLSCQKSQVVLTGAAAG